MIQRAMFTFWQQGFESTTLTDLETATGVDRSTLYNSFGGKAGLYESAAEGYVDLATEQLFDPLHNGDAGLDDIVEMLNRLDASYRSGAPPGCYIVNDMSSMDGFDARTRYLTVLRTGFERALTRAATRKEIDQDAVDRRAGLLTASLIGVNLVHKDAGDAAYGLLEALRTEVRAWATES